MSVKKKLSLTLKNLPGWRTKRKLVVFSVDDFGNIRVASKKARENLIKAGVRMDENRFDQYDALENAEDLNYLFETLTSARDSNNNPAVFTAFALPANIDFARMEDEGYHTYYYETLPQTLNRLPGYEGTWAMWQEGMEKKLIVPQFHGREHVNINWLMSYLKESNPHVLACMHEHSLAGLNFSHYPTTSYVSAFSFYHFDENIALAQIASDGLKIFDQVFGFKPVCFNAPGSPAHTVLEKTLAEGGVRYIDTSIVKKEHQGRGKYKYKVNPLGSVNKYGQHYLIRNCVFEPLLHQSVSVDRTLAEIDNAFLMGKPAIISSHRVNFCGHVNPKNRETGIGALKKLLKKIIHRWPNVEFMAANELGDIITGQRL